MMRVERSARRPDCESSTAAAVSAAKTVGGGTLIQDSCQTGVWLVAMKFGG